MGHKVSRQVYATVSSLAENVHQLISFTEDAWYLSLHIDELTVHIYIITWVRCACSLLCGPRYAMLTRSHMMARIGTLLGRHQIVLLTSMSWRVLYACVYRIVFLLPISCVC